MWRTIKINIQNIKAESDKAIKIACPRHSHLGGFCFWHPLKLVNISKRTPEIMYTENFEFRLKKYSHGDHRKWEVIEERTVGYMDIEEAFGQGYDEPLIHTPESIEPERSEADEELIDEQSRVGV